MVLVFVVFVLVMVAFVFVMIVFVLAMTMVVLVTTIVVILAACLYLIHQRADTLDVGVRHRQGDVRQGRPDQGSTGNGDAPINWVARENVSLEQRRQRRSRQCRSGVDCPKHVTRLPAVGHGHLEPTAREGCLDFENPDPIRIRGPVERQCCIRERHRRGKTAQALAHCP